MKIAALLIINMMFLNCAINAQKNSNGDDTTRNSDGLYIPMNLVKKAIGQWRSDTVTITKEKNFILKGIYGFTLKSDASGNFNLKIIVNEKNSIQALTLFFHIYPWGIANNRNNVNMFYIKLNKGVVQRSTFTDKFLEESIKSEFLKLIEENNGFSAILSSIHNTRIQIERLKPSGIYPKTWTRINN